MQPTRESEGEREFPTRNMEKNEKTAVTTAEPQVKYRGIKAMPFVIGKEMGIFFSFRD